MKAYSTTPWLVENIDDFNFLFCPECAYKSKDEDALYIQNMKKKQLARPLVNIRRESIIFDYGSGHNIVEYVPSTRYFHILLLLLKYYVAKTGFQFIFILLHSSPRRWAGEKKSASMKYNTNIFV